MLRWSGPHEIIANPHPNVYTIGLEKDALGLDWSKQTTVNVARLLSYTPFKHSAAPAVLRASVEARKTIAKAQLQSRKQAATEIVVEQEELFLSSTGWNALGDFKPSSDLSIEQKQSEVKRLKFLNEHIKQLRNRFVFDSADDSFKEPHYSTCAEAEARIADLTSYVTHIMEYNNFYDTVLVIRDYPETKIYTPALNIHSNALEHVYHNFASFMNHQPTVKRAPIPLFEYGPIPLDDPEGIVTLSPLLSESKLETRDNKLASSHNIPMHSHTFLRGATARAAKVGNPWKFNFQPGVDNKRPNVVSRKA